MSNFNPNLRILIGSLFYNNDKGTLDVLDDEGMPRKRFEASSGKPGVTDSTKKNEGPIPSGNYSVDPGKATKNNILMRMQADWGKNKVPIDPAKDTNTHGRSGFYMHGGQKPGSAGCVDVGNCEKDLFKMLKKHNRVIPFKVK